MLVYRGKTSSMAKITLRLAIPASGVAKQIIFELLWKHSSIFYPIHWLYYLLPPKCYSYATSCNISDIATVATCTRSGAIFSTKFVPNHPHAQKEKTTKWHKRGCEGKDGKKHQLYTLIPSSCFELNPNISREAWITPSFWYFDQALCHKQENLSCILPYSFYPLTGKVR